MMNIKRVISTIEKNYILSNLKKGERIDGRDLWEYRDWTVKSGIIASAEGSSEVTLGKTKVMTGLKYDVGAPFPDLPALRTSTVSSRMPIEIFHFSARAAHRDEYPYAIPSTATLHHHEYKTSYVLRPAAIKDSLLIPPWI